MIDRVLAKVPQLSRIVVVGVCMGDDTFRPVMGTNKELELRFVFSSDPAEFREALLLLASGKVDGRPLITSTIGLDEVPAAFDRLGQQPDQVKVMVDPGRR